MAIITFPQHLPTYSPIGSEGSQASTTSESWSTVIDIDGRGYVANFVLNGSGAGSSAAEGRARIYVDSDLVYSGIVSGSAGFNGGEHLGVVQLNSILAGWFNDATIARVPLPAQSLPIKMNGVFPNTSADRLAALSGYLHFNSNLRIEISIHGGVTSSYLWSFSGGVA